MSAAKDRPVSKPASDQYRENFDRIFGKKPEDTKPQEPQPKKKDTKCF